MAAGARLFGREAMQKKLLNAAKKALTKPGEALYEEMGIELLEVIKRTPELSGKLRSTEKLMGPVIENKKVVVLIVAGGTEAPYAVVVHEDLEAFHKIGQAKYLESVILESRSFIGARVAKRLNIADWTD